MRGVKTIATKAPGYGPFANFASSPSQDKSLRFIEQVTPVVALPDTQFSSVPADLYYIHWGVTAGSPSWMSDGSGTNQLIDQWDASDGRLYRRLGTAGGAGQLGYNGAQAGYFYPTGFCGVATQFAPKNPNAQQVIFGSRLRFPDNIDYGAYGWGAAYNMNGDFVHGLTTHAFNFGRSGTGFWRLYTKDDTTRTSTDSTVADDGNWHDVFVVWTVTAITAYVDNVAVISKATNLPARPVHPFALGDNTHHVDIVDYRIHWEGD